MRGKTERGHKNLPCAHPVVLLGQALDDAEDVADGVGARLLSRLGVAQRGLPSRCQHRHKGTQARTKTGWHGRRQL